MKDVLLLATVAWLNVNAGGPPVSQATPETNPSASTPAPAASPTPAADRFPAAWAGKWTGLVRTMKPEGEPLEFDMELLISPTEKPQRMTWRIIYRYEGNETVRNYEIVTIDPAKGKFLIDENNSVKIESYLVAETLHSQFVVEHSIITASYAKRGQKLDFRLVVADTRNPVISGGENDAPKVETHAIEQIQWGTLSREVDQAPSQATAPGQ